MKINVGLPAKYIFKLADYSASDGYVLTGKLVDSSGNVTALADTLFDGDGTVWTLSIPAATTTGYTAGDYVLYIIATLDAEDTLALRLPAVVETLGTLSHAQKMVTALRSLMEGRSAKGYESLTTSDGESITRLDPEKLQKWLAYYERRLASEKAITGTGQRVKNIQVGF